MGQQKFLTFLDYKDVGVCCEQW